MVDILHKVGIKAPMDEVYKALASRDGLAGWWSSETQGDGKLGTTLAFRFSAGGTEIGVIEMKVLQLEPPLRVLWEAVGGPEEWIGTKIAWELRQDGEYVIVLFKHQGWKEPVEFMHHCSTKWAIYMMSLKSLLESGKGAPNPHDLKIDSWD